jgi:ribosomal protein L37E
MPLYLRTDPTVRCPFCGRQQPDPHRQRATCSYCGASPLPSRTYPRDSPFYPKPKQRQIDG